MKESIYVKQQTLYRLTQSTHKSQFYLNYSLPRWPGAVELFIWVELSNCSVQRLGRY